MIDTPWVLVWGASKIVMSSIVPTLLNYSNKMIFVTSGSENLSELEYVRLTPQARDNYGLFYASDDNFSSVDDVINEAKKREARVVVVAAHSRLYSSLLEENPPPVAVFSGCRDGIFGYMEEISSIIPDKKLEILTVDNNEIMVQNAIDVAPANITIFPCSVHCVCDSCTVSNDGKEMLVHCTVTSKLLINGNFGRFDLLFKYSLRINQHVRAYYIPAEFMKDYATLKLINVNLIHTVISVVAYVTGLNKGMTVEEIAHSRYSDILDRESYIKYVDIVYNDLNTKIIRPIEEAVGEKIVIDHDDTLEFLDWTLSDDSTEVIGRGLNPLSDDFRIKLEYHESIFNLLSASEFIEVFDTFKEEFNIT